MDFGRALREAVGRDLRRAAKARDRGRVATLRTVMAAIDNAEAVEAEQAYDYNHPGLGGTEVPRRELDAAEVGALLDHEIAERRAAAAIFRDAGRAAAAASLDVECALLGGYRDALPWLGPPRIRPLDPAAGEVTLAAERMRATLVEVLGEDRGATLHNHSELEGRVLWHLDPDHVSAAFVAEDADGCVVGHVLVRRDDDGAGLFATFYVLPAARRAGVARHLVEWGEAWFAERGLTLARTCTHPENRPLIALLEGRGYRLEPVNDDFVRLERRLD